MSKNNRNEYSIEESKLGAAGIENQMSRFKEEIASEIGLAGYNNMDKRWIPAVQHGYVGGNMTKRMINFAEQAIAAQGSQIMKNVGALDVSPEVRRANELVSNNFQQFTEALKNGTLMNLIGTTNGAQDNQQNNQSQGQDYIS